MARFIARTQQKYTQRGGMRPFGVSCMLAGFGTDGAPQVHTMLFHTIHIIQYIKYSTTLWLLLVFIEI
jgi:Proteasome subunit